MYAIISVGGKQYRVQEGERLLVDRLPHDEGTTFQPRILLLGGDGETQLAPEGVTVTARVVGHVLGDKVRIGKYRPKTGYRRHAGYRSRLSQVEIETIGKKASRGAKAETPERKEEAAAAEVAALPDGYGSMTVAAIGEAAASWDVQALEAALEYEQGHGKRKGALAALESALETQKEKQDGA